LLLGQLLIPQELRQGFSSDRPLVLALDAATARIHWEMLAQPSPILTSANDDDDLDSDGAETRAYQAFFLGTARGLTRQLRTTFAVPSEPAMNQRRVLRVLVVADPAEDAPLEGAEAEGAAVASLFDEFNSLSADTTKPRIRFQVTPLFGPSRATRTNVLREITATPYDILHYAGHCYYNKEQPELSGWVFRLQDKEILSANELRRMDRVPRFIFSNACESGITPDRADERTAALAPSFAESFFERGVANFVCTAWPVGDAAALAFALTLYRELLGLTLEEDGKSYKREDPKPMYWAMRMARQAIVGTTDGRKTWGAYQHYGNPHFQLIFGGTATP
jgi:hypothetical protein